MTYSFVNEVFSILTNPRIIQLVYCRTFLTLYSNCPQMFQQSLHNSTPLTVPHVFMTHPAVLSSAQAVYHRFIVPAHKRCQHHCSRTLMDSNVLPKVAHELHKRWGLAWCAAVRLVTCVLLKYSEQHAITLTSCDSTFLPPHLQCRPCSSTLRLLLYIMHPGPCFMDGRSRVFAQQRGAVHQSQEVTGSLQLGLRICKKEIENQDFFKRQRIDLKSMKESSHTGGKLRRFYTWRSVDRELAESCVIFTLWGSRTKESETSEQQML